ncbi:hypothetical protein Mgra_00008039 [Meloidogyne graminicola]|uniref:Uncharacterized protein n=1 Tax=Meloidogyne graminicola TaxID=189291 RepID=A0A8S9ZGT2_9BILA|nr:hypothetical protein Mgra_00009891 [Meloidogyne graminicola]KAF7632524.1 hypothetical protein Mgra_00008039 [Meloidogyne graminicola]
MASHASLLNSGSIDEKCHTLFDGVRKISQLSDYLVSQNAYLIKRVRDLEERLQQEADYNKRLHQEMDYNRWTFNRDQ